jgi:hypothetical protein
MTSALVWKIIKSYSRCRQQVILQRCKRPTIWHGTRSLKAGIWNFSQRKLVAYLRKHQSKQASRAVLCDYLRGFSSAILFYFQSNISRKTLTLFRIILNLTVVLFKLHAITLDTKLRFILLSSRFYFTNTMQQVYKKCILLLFTGSLHNVSPCLF